MDARKRYQKIKEISIIGAIANFFLSIVKIIIGYISHSQALIADGIHSFSDLLTDFIVIIATYFGSQKADKNHPYGHARIETAATSALSLVLALIAFGIMYDSIHLLIYESAETPTWLAVWILLATIITKEILFHITIKVAKQTNSNLLNANAWHHRTDSISSAIALIGVLIAIAGFAYFDAIAAILVAFLILHISWRLMNSSVKELVDTGVDEETLNEITKTIANIEGVESMHQIRTRSMASKIFVDVHIQVAPKISVSEGHYIAQQVHYKLMQLINNIVDVTVHVDAEEDEIAAWAKDLPNRKQILQDLNNLSPNLINNICDIKIHYLNKKIDLEIFTKHDLNYLTKNIKNIHYINTIKIINV